MLRKMYYQGRLYYTDYFPHVNPSRTTAVYQWREDHHFTWWDNYTWVKKGGK